jgi:hypothetical protein
MEEAEQVFLVAMLKHLTGGHGVFITPVTDFYTLVEIPMGKFRVTRHIHENQNSGIFSETTVITHGNDLVWSMHCSGQYPVRVREFLQYVLTETYRSKLFFGGRGLTTDHNCNPYFYLCRCHGGFDCFSGDEEIRSRGTNNILGKSHFSGMSML